MSLHTYAFHLRDFTVYLGIDSPTKRCGKSTLLTLLRHLVNRPILASNITPSALFRVIEQVRPTLLIDEADRLLRGNHKLKGILNAGYNRDTGFVLRVVHQPAPTAKPEPGSPNSTAPDGATALLFSSWCPKAIASIGRLPEVLADRCIVIHMQRKTRTEKSDRLRHLAPIAPELRRKCARFILDHQQEIARATPAIPDALNDRAADLWEPLFLLADIAGGRWPDLARQAALALSADAQQSNPAGSLLFDIWLQFTQTGQDRLSSRELIASLNSMDDRPWRELLGNKPLTEQWLARQLALYGIRPRGMRICARFARGYLLEDIDPAFRRYAPKLEAEAAPDAAQIPGAKPATPLLPEPGLLPLAFDI